MKVIIGYVGFIIVLILGTIFIQAGNLRSENHLAALTLHEHHASITNDVSHLIVDITTYLNGGEVDIPIPHGLIIDGLETRGGIVWDWRNGVFYGENTSRIVLTLEPTSPFGPSVMFTRKSQRGIVYAAIPHSFWAKFTKSPIVLSVDVNGRTLYGRKTDGLVIATPVGDFPIVLSSIYPHGEIWRNFFRQQAAVLAVMTLSFILFGVLLLSLVRKQRALTIALKDAEVATITQSKIIANTSHELRTPLNSIIGFSDLLLTGGLSERHRRYITAINTSGKELLSLVDDIISFAKMEEGRFSLMESEFLLSPPLNTAISLLERRAVSMGISFVVTSDLPDRMFGDEKRILQIFHYMGNLTLVNSLSAAMVDIRHTDGLVMVFSTDRVEPECDLSLAHSGNFLTLPLVEHLTILHGGTFTMRKDAHHPHGTSVILTFPRWRTEDV